MATAAGRAPLPSVPNAAGVPPAAETRMSLTLGGRRREKGRVVVGPGAAAARWGVAQIDRRARRSPRPFSACRRRRTRAIGRPARRTGWLRRRRGQGRGVESRPAQRVHARGDRIGTRRAAGNRRRQIARCAVVRREVLDPVALAVATGLLMLCALVAALIPGSRAASVILPMLALRLE